MHRSAHKDQFRRDETMLFFCELLLSRMRAAKNRSGRDARREFGGSAAYEHRWAEIPTTVFARLRAQLSQIAAAAGLRMDVLNPFGLKKGHVVVRFVKRGQC